jgi:hypothetical protein
MNFGLRTIKMVKKRKKMMEVKDFWFKRRTGNKDGWSFIPMNWRGWVALVSLVGVNVFAANYFRVNEFVLDNWLSFGVVFLLSFAVFVLIAKVKTSKR